MVSLQMDTASQSKLRLVSRASENLFAMSPAIQVWPRSAAFGIIETGSRGNLWSAQGGVLIEPSPVFVGDRRFLLRSKLRRCEPGTRAGRLLERAVPLVCRRGSQRQSIRLDYRAPGAAQSLAGRGT